MCTVVLAHGCWDILHSGHIDHLKEASKLGGWLTVSVTSDQYVNKGPGRPYFKAADRAKLLRALRFVDEVIINDAPTAVDAILRIAPAIYAKGIDYTDSSDVRLFLEKAAVAKVGGRFVLTGAAKTGSSTAIFEKMHGSSV